MCLRCGVDLGVPDSGGKTVEDLLRVETTGPPTSNALLYWFEQFKPGGKQPTHLSRLLFMLAFLSQYRLDVIYCVRMSGYN